MAFNPIKALFTPRLTSDEATKNEPQSRNRRPPTQPISVPNAFTSDKERNAFCENRMEAIRTGTSESPQPDLILLTQQLKHLKSERSIEKQAAHAGHSVIRAVGKFNPVLSVFGSAFKSPRLATVREAKELLKNEENRASHESASLLADSDKQTRLEALIKKDEADLALYEKFKQNSARSRHALAQTYGSPQKRTFDFLLSTLDPRIDARRKHNHQKNQQKILLDIVLAQRTQSYTAPLKHRIEDLETRRAGHVSAEEVQRRMTSAPVWAALLQQAQHVKYERKEMLVKSFAHCFYMLPFAQQGNMIQAFAGSLAELAKALPELHDPKHPDSQSDVQMQALTLLRQLSADMTRKQQTELADTLNEIMSDRPDLYEHPVMIEISHLRESLLRTGPQP